MKGNFTNETWCIKETIPLYDEEEIHIETKDGFTIAHLFVDKREGVDKETIANARLIAAAPRLFALLNDISNVIPDDTGKVELSAENI